MGSSSVRSAAGFSVSVHVDGLDRTTRMFKDYRNHAARELRSIQQRAAEETVLPEAKRNVGRLRIAKEAVPTHLVVRKGLRNSVILTTNLRGMRARAVGLIEFGGTVRTPILPKKKKALAFGGGHPVAAVRTVRHYRARLSMTRARDEALPAFGQNVRDRLAGEFASAGFEVS